jgi:hypothetical protein
MFHSENKSNQCIRKYVNLLHFNRYKSPTCFGPLCGLLQGGVFTKGIKIRIFSFVLIELLPGVLCFPDQNVDHIQIEGKVASVHAKRHIEAV